jgi:pimeloyl-ACP methyl ester carboxylesterase
MIDCAPAFVSEQKDHLWASVEPAALASIACPMLLMQGDESPTWFRPIVTKLADAIDGAQVHTYGGAGHAPHLTHPADYLAVVSGFLSRVAERGVEAGIAVA